MRLRHPRVVVGLVSLLALTACDLYPDAGQWAGLLSVREGSGLDRYSCSVDVDITHTGDVLSLNSVDSYCGERSLHWSPSVLRNRGDGLWRGDERVGDIDPDGTVRIELRDPYYTDHYPSRPDRVTLQWNRVGDRLQFLLTEYAGARTRTMEGALERKE